MYHIMTRIIKNIFNKSERCRDVKTQKIMQTRLGSLHRTQNLKNHFHITLHKYLHHYKTKYKELYICTVHVKYNMYMYFRYTILCFV